MFQQFGIKRENITSVDLWQRHVSERLFFHIEVPQVKIICSGRGLQFDVVIHVDLEHIIQGKFHDKPTAIKNQPQNPLNEWIHCHMETYLFSNQEALTVKDVRASSLRCDSSYVKQCTNDNY